MSQYTDSPMIIKNPPISARHFRPNHPPSVRQGCVSVYAELHHYSLIAYKIPAERAKAIVPDSFQVEETVQDGRHETWLSVVSVLDQGSQRDGHGVFEQTSYRLHVLRNGNPAHFLLGISLGSLSAVAIRNLWPVPWHLSAMEFQVAYDQTEGRYRGHRLQTQSQWDNASWEISDTGELVLPHQIQQLELPSSLSANALNNYFLRRDGSLGLLRVRYYDLAWTWGRLEHAQSDLLERLGLLTNDELTRPALVAIQHKVTCQIFSPTILGDVQVESHKFEPERRRLPFAS